MEFGGAGQAERDGVPAGFLCALAAGLGVPPAAFALRPRRVSMPSVPGGGLARGCRFWVPPSWQFTASCANRAGSAALFGPRPIAQVADLRIPLRQPRRNRTSWRMTVPGYGLGSAAMPMRAVMSTTVAA